MANRTGIERGLTSWGSPRGAARPHGERSAELRGECPEEAVTLRLYPSGGVRLEHPSPTFALVVSKRLADRCAFRGLSLPGLLIQLVAALELQLSPFAMRANEDLMTQPPVGDACRNQIAGCALPPCHPGMR